MLVIGRQLPGPIDSGAVLNVAVIGAGYWGPNLVRNFHANPQTKVEWVVDADLGKARRLAARFPPAQSSDDLDAVLARGEVDAIAIATPAGTHAPLALRAMEAGCHVLVEKPLATTVADGETMVRTARERGLVLMADHTFCYTPAVQKIREIIRSGTLGSVRYFDSVRINLGLVQSDVDVFWDLAPHDLSILDFVLPDDVTVLSVSATGADPVGAGHACIGYVTMPLSNGGIAHAHLNWLSPSKIRTTIIGGSEKMIVWDDLRPSQRISVFDSGVEVERDLDDDLRRALLVSYRAGDMFAPALDGSEALAGVVDEFVDSIGENRPPLTDGEAGLRVLRLLEAIDASVARGGAPVEVAS